MTFLLAADVFTTPHIAVTAVIFGAGAFLAALVNNERSKLGLVDSVAIGEDRYGRAVAAATVISFAVNVITI